MEEIYAICKTAMACIVRNDYKFLRKQNALTRAAEADIKRVLSEYDPSQNPMMPPDSYYRESAHIYTYTDGSGYAVEFNFWYPSGESDLELQLDIRKRRDGLHFIIHDVLVP